MSMKFYQLTSSSLKKSIDVMFPALHSFQPPPASGNSYFPVSINHHVITADRDISQTYLRIRHTDTQTCCNRMESYLIVPGPRSSLYSGVLHSSVGKFITLQYCQKMCGFNFLAEGLLLDGGKQVQTYTVCVVILT